MSDRSRRRGSAGGNTDPVARYLGTFQRLRSRKRWSTNTATFRFVALALGTAGASVTYDHLESAAEVLRKRARATSPLRSEIRYVVAAMILRRGQDPGAIQARVRETLDAFKVQGLPRRGAGPTLAALLLVLLREGRPVPPVQIERLARIYSRRRADHVLLTSANDLPAAALHAGQDNSVEILTAQVDRAYDRLREAGFRRGNPLQLVSHLLSVDPRGTDTGVQRFSRVADHLGRAGEPVRSSRYDEIAMLALTHETPSRVVGRTLRYRDRLRAEKPRPAKELAFSLAVGIELAEDAEDAGKRSTGDLAALQSIKAILDAQQAAVVAAVSVAVATG